MEQENSSPDQDRVQFGAPNRFSRRVGISDADFVQVLHTVERVLVYAISPRSLEFLFSIATGKHTHAKRSCSPCRKQVPNVIRHHHRIMNGDAQLVGSCKEEVRVRFGMADLVPRCYRYSGLKP
jgi:predicted SprT family Zn-dependent metalloprotease